jgi:hypothetical protein
MKLKLQSPSPKTMVIELANGGDGYIPPPEQHQLGGYNTWAARSAGLEVNAEPRIVATDLHLLEQVFGKPRRKFEQTLGLAATPTGSSSPVAYWRLHEFSPPVAHDETGNGHRAVFEPGVLFFLEGDDSRQFTLGETNRCVHFAGGRMRSDLPELTNDFIVKMSFWNGMPDDAREIAGWMFSRDHEFTTSATGVHLGLGGQGEASGRLILQLGTDKPLSGNTDIKRWTWHQVRLEQRGADVRVFLDEAAEPEIVSRLASTGRNFPPLFFFGGRSDSQDNWEGRLDEIAVFK